MQIKEVMSPKPEVLASEATIREAAMQMQKNDSGLMPIFQNDKLIGVVTDRDIAVRGVANGKGPDEKVTSILTDEVQYCVQDDDVKSALINMHQKQVQRFVVLNNAQDKELVGVVSVADIADKCDDAESAQAIAEACKHYH